MDTITQTAKIELDEAITFVNLEADRLDHAEYDDWLASYSDDALYIVPIEPGETDFAHVLNYAYDDHAMRKKRVDRLLNGQSISTSPVARTVRILGRFRLISSTPDRAELRAAQFLTEFRRGTERSYAADVEFILVREPAGLKIARKVIRLINSTDALRGIGYIL